MVSEPTAKLSLSNFSVLSSFPPFLRPDRKDSTELQPDTETFSTHTHF